MDTDSSSKFIGSLTKFLQSLCNGYVEFNRGVELVGHIYLNIDTGEKVDYILHEKVSKNDENSVTFVSNSFHAQPLDKEKAENKDNPSKSGASSKGRKDSEDDDDDIMIVDQSNSKGVPGSTNSGSIPSRGVKRLGSPNFSDRQNQRIRGSGGFSSGINRGSSNFQQNNRQHSGPSATVTSQHQEGIDIGDVKLEQISKDELMSLASQVNDGGGSRPSHTASSTPVSSHSRSGMWIKQEAADDDNDGGNEGWSHGREDSNSNSGSNLYPVMLHQNPAAYSSGSAFPGFSGAGPSGSQSGANLYGDPLPGTSQDSSGLDPSALVTGFQNYILSLPHSRQGSKHLTDKPLSQFESTQEETRYQQYRRHIRQTNPDRYQLMKQRQRECMKKLRAKRKEERAKIADILKNQDLGYLHGGSFASDPGTGSVHRGSVQDSGRVNDSGNFLDHSDSDNRPSAGAEEDQKGDESQNQNSFLDEVSKEAIRRLWYGRDDDDEYDADAAADDDGTKS